MSKIRGVVSTLFFIVFLSYDRILIEGLILLWTYVLILYAINILYISIGPNIWHKKYNMLRNFTLVSIPTYTGNSNIKLEFLYKKSKIWTLLYTLYSSVKFKLRSKQLTYQLLHFAFIRLFSFADKILII